MVWDSGVRVLGLRVEDLGGGTGSWGFRVQGLGFGV